MLENGMLNEIWWMNLRGFNDNWTVSIIKKNWKDVEMNACMRREWEMKWNDIKMPYQPTCWKHVLTCRGHESTHSTHVLTHTEINLKNSKNCFHELTYTKHESTTHEVQQVKKLKHKVLDRLWKTKIKTCMNGFWETHANNHFFMIC